MKMSIHSVSVKTITGEEIKLSDYEGKTLLIVNVASACGLTKQYTGLEELYHKYKEKGLVVLGFPCNQFGAQEPGSEEEIQTFCSTKYSVTFPLFSKIEVNGENKSPLYEILNGATASYPGDITWNFEKFLINTKGDVVSRFSPKTTPEDTELVNAIEKEVNS
jgi:glutathione peroxidase